MLKKYKHSGMLLSAAQMKEIKGGLADAQQAKVQCDESSDCGRIICISTNDVRWVCRNDGSCALVSCS